MDWNAIKERVEKGGNVATFNMLELRDAHGAGKLGVKVRAEISDLLAGIGLGHIPAELPNYQHEQVRLYKKGTPVGQLIDCVLVPGEQNDKLLAEKFSSAGPDHADMIRRIREIVSE